VRAFAREVVVVWVGSQHRAATPESLCVSSRADVVSLKTQAVMYAADLLGISKQAEVAREHLRLSTSSLVRMPHALLRDA